jgi:hypothetical protein
MKEEMPMGTTQRVRRAGLATAAALVIGGSGFAIGAAATGSRASGTTAGSVQVTLGELPGS